MDIIHQNTKFQWVQDVNKVINDSEDILVNNGSGNQL